MKSTSTFRNILKGFTLLIALFCCGLLQAKEWVPILGAGSFPQKVQLISSDAGSTVLSFHVDGFYKTQVAFPSGDAYVISVPEGTPQLVAGAPDLPKLTASLAIPDAGEMQITILSSSYVDYPDLFIAPSKGNLYRDINPSDIQYRYGASYTQNAFWPSDNASLRTPFIVRDFRGQTVVVNPFQYNPITKVLRVYTEIKVQVTPLPGVKGQNELVRTKPVTNVDPEFAQIYTHLFKNAPTIQYTSLPEEGNLLIICHDAWMPEMQALVDWKIRKGIHTEMVNVLTAGGSASAIQAYIANYYATNGLTYVLLVGDAAQVPSLYAQGGASDPSYGYILGNDSYAEVMVGRFSAESADDVTTQVQRVLNYEMTPDPGATWLGNGVVIGSNQGPGDDNEMDWEHEFNIRTDLMGFTYTNVSELYDGTHVGTSDAAGDPAAGDLFSLFQSGIGIMTYTGHGSSQSCGTTGLSVSDVQNMTNTNMLPFIWSVACVNGQFDMAGGPCFAEEFLRAQVGGQPTGAVATFMSTINQSWNPPMDGQDEMVDLLVGTAVNGAKRTFGGLSVNGCMHMNDQYAAAGAEMTDTWHCFGDPTLNVRTSTPQAMVVSHPGVLPIGSSTLMVNCSFDGALVALSMNGDVISTALVSNGIALFNFSALSTVDTLFVTATGFNQIPYLGEIAIIPANGPYVIYQSNSSHDTQGNQNGIIEYAETIDVDLTLMNMGNAIATNVSATLTTTDLYVTILNGTSNWGSLSSNATAAVNSAFSYTIANNIPDQHVIYFTITITDGNGNSWVSTFTQVVNAPALDGGILSVDDSAGGDGDGFLEPGETAVLTIRCLNNGHSDALLTTALLNSTDPLVNVINGTANPGTIAFQNYVDAQFTVSLSPNITFGTSFTLDLNLNAGAYTGLKYYPLSAGIIVEDFETNDFSKFNWSSSGSLPWLTTSDLPFEGLYCAVSGDINDSQTSELLLSINAMADDSVTYWYKVSSEQGWDFFRTYLDGNQVTEFSGTIPWSYTGFSVTSGIHTVRFSYEKDNVYSSGLDAAWLDNIRFPAGTTITAVQNITTTNGIAVYPNPAADWVSIDFKKEQGVNSRIAMIDLSGRVVLQSPIENLSGNKSHCTFNVSELSAGIYFLKIENAGSVLTYKISIVH
ncbi:hypothetical protein BH11BAC2_BH11BAC2_23830 [soil metagenome]